MKLIGTLIGCWKPNLRVRKLYLLMPPKPWKDPAHALAEEEVGTKIIKTDSVASWYTEYAHSPRNEGQGWRQEHIHGRRGQDPDCIGGVWSVKKKKMVGISLELKFSHIPFLLKNFSALHDSQINLISSLAWFFTAWVSIVFRYALRDPGPKASIHLWILPQIPHFSAFHTTSLSSMALLKALLLCTPTTHIQPIFEDSEQLPPSLQSIPWPLHPQWLPWAPTSPPFIWSWCSSLILFICLPFTLTVSSLGIKLSLCVCLSV